MDVQTDGAADAKQVYVPALDEQGVHRAHHTSITRLRAACPSRRRHRGRRTRGTLVWLHTGANVSIHRAYSAALENAGKRYPAEISGRRSPGRPGGPDGPAQGRRRSALADPGHRRLALTGRKVLAVAPGAAGAVVVMTLPARNADHAPIFSLSSSRYLLAAVSGRCLWPLSGRGQDDVRAAPGPSWPRVRRGRRDWLDACAGLLYREEAGRQACQAALARRIRRRRSAARSSSFRPPHTPYFSGRDSA